MATSVFATLAQDASVQALTSPFMEAIPGGEDVTPGVPTLLAAAVGRAYIAINLLDRDTSDVQVPTTAKLWIGWGQAAEEGVGDWIAFNGRTDNQFFQGDVHVLLVGHNTPVRVTWVEWMS